MRDENSLRLNLRRALYQSVAVVQIAAFMVPMGALAADEKKGVDPCASTGGLVADSSLQQKKQYCDAAKAADKAAKNNKTIGSLYAANAAVCAANAAACIYAVNTFVAAGTAMAFDYACIGFSVGTAVIDGVMTKNYTGAMMGLIGPASNLLIGGATGVVATAAGPTFAGGGSAKPCIPSVVSTLMAGVQVMMNSNSAKDNKKTADQNRQAAGMLTDPDAAANPSIATSNQNGTSGGIRSASTRTSGGGSGGAETTESENQGSCAGTGASGAIACALAADKNLPSALASPQFLKDLEKVTGMKADDFFSLDPKDALQRGMGASVPSQSLPKLAALISEMESRVGKGSDVQGAAYAGGGGGGAQKGSDEPDLNALFSKLLPGQEGQPGQPEAPTDLVFEKLERNPGMADEDKTISLFKRVSFRYTKKRTDLAQTSWTLPHNQMLSGQGAPQAQGRSGGLAQ